MSCVSGTHCAAVGSYRNSTNSGLDVALTESLSGGTWSAPTIAPPAGAGTGAGAELLPSSVSCTGAVPARPGTTRTRRATGSGSAESYVPSQGYWSVASDGGIFTYGPGATFEGSTGGRRLNTPIVGMAADARWRGLLGGGRRWGHLQLGNAGFHGSTGSLRLNAPIVGMAATPDGGGYWLVASDGGIFNYGDASFYGSAGSIHLNKPIVGMAASPDGHGYWLVASDGGIFSYGDAVFHGSRGGQPLEQAHRRHSGERVRGWATGSSRPTAASSATAMPTSSARPAPLR